VFLERDFTSKALTALLRKKIGSAAGYVSAAAFALKFFIDLYHMIL
jgi:hypothetical protein